MPSTVATFANSEFRMRYREPYVTEGLNAKFVVNTPPGTYRGFRLASNVGLNDTIYVQADVDALDHAAVYQTLDGFSLTIRKTGGTYSVDLSSLVDASEKTWVIAIYADYAVGSTSTAILRAYELAPTDEFSVAAEKEELVILGTVVIPAGGGVPIPVGNVTHDRRTNAYEAQAIDAVAWHPVLRNSGFESGEIASYALGDRNIQFWNLTNSDLTYSLQDSDVYSGKKALKLGKVAGPYSGSPILQLPYVPVTAGKQLRVRIAKKSFADAAPTGNTKVYPVVSFLDKTGAVATAIEIPADLNNVAGDGDYVIIDRTIAIPSNATVLAAVGLNFDGVMTGGTEPLPDWLYIDDFQVWVEASSASYAVPEYQSTRESLWGGELILEDPNVNYGGSSGVKSALLSFSAATPSGSGTVTIAATEPSTKDPDLSLGGVLSSLGSDFVDTAANARIPRMTVVARNSVTEYTLLSEAGYSSFPKQRVYTNNRGVYYLTTNAEWNGTQWQRDAAGDSTLLIQGDITGVLRFYIYPGAGASPWNEPGGGAPEWDSGRMINVTTTGLDIDSQSGDMTLTANAQVTVSPILLADIRRLDASSVVGASSEPFDIVYSDELRLAGAGASAVDIGVLSVSSGGTVGGAPIDKHLIGVQEDASDVDGRMVWDCMGFVRSKGVRLFDDFFGPTLHPMWSVNGTPTMNYKSRSAVRLTGVESVYISACLKGNAYPAMRFAVEWDSITGISRFGLFSAGVLWHGFSLDSATHGNSNIHVACWGAGGSTEFYDTGYEPKLDSPYELSMCMYQPGSASLQIRWGIYGFSATGAYPSIFASGWFDPPSGGPAHLSSTTSLDFSCYTSGTADLVVDAVEMISRNVG